MLELDILLHNRPAACVIAQHYSSATFVVLRFHSSKENLGEPFNKRVTLLPAL
jgi:hypothetical protein